MGVAYSCNQACKGNLHLAYSNASWYIWHSQCSKFPIFNEWEYGSTCRLERGKHKSATSHTPVEADAASTVQSRLSVSGATESSRSHGDELLDADISLDKVKVKFFSLRLQCPDPLLLAQSSRRNGECKLGCSASFRLIHSSEVRFMLGYCHGRG